MIRKVISDLSRFLCDIDRDISMDTLATWTWLVLGAWVLWALIGIVMMNHSARTNR